MIETFSWIITVIAIYGTYLNTQRNIRGFYLWLVSNSAFCAMNFVHHMYAQGFLFGVYTVLALIGIKNWKKQ